MRDTKQLLVSDKVNDLICDVCGIAENEDTETEVAIPIREDDTLNTICIDCHQNNIRNLMLDFYGEFC